MKLLKAYHFSEDFTRDGIPVWWDESDDVVFEGQARTSRSQAAIDRKKKLEKEAVPGRYYIAVPKTRGGAPFPTFDDWVAEQERRKGRK